MKKTQNRLIKKSKKNHLNIKDLKPKSTNDSRYDLSYKVNAYNTNMRKYLLNWYQSDDELSHKVNNVSEGILCTVGEEVLVNITKLRGKQWRPMGLFTVNNVNYLHIEAALNLVATDQLIIKSEDGVHALYDEIIDQYSNMDSGLQYEVYNEFLRKGYMVRRHRCDWTEVQNHGNPNDEEDVCIDISHLPIRIETGDITTEQSERLHKFRLKSKTSYGVPDGSCKAVFDVEKADKLAAVTAVVVVDSKADLREISFSPFCRRVKSTFLCAVNENNDISVLEIRVGPLPRLKIIQTPS